MADPRTPKTEVGETYRKRLEELAATAEANFTAGVGQGPSKWFRPSTVTHSPLTITGSVEVHRAFNRDEQEKWFDESTKDPNNRGTVGDLAQIQLQGDMLACMERAYRARHISAVQSRLYPAARLRGHGHQYGVIRYGILGYITGIDKINKGEPA